MRRSYCLWAAVPALLIPVWAGAQTPAPLLHQTFEEDAGGWQPIPGTTAKVAVTHEAANVKEGKGALQFDYTVEKGGITAMLLPTPNALLAKMKSLRFWVKSGQATSLIVSLQEKDGGRYNAAFSVPKDTWQQVELAPSDFTLSVGKDDPKDPDNKLDLDQVEGIVVADFAQILQAAGSEAAAMFQIQTGPRTLYLDDLTVGAEPLPNAAASATNAAILDAFAHPQPDWIALGATTTGIATGKPLDGRGLKSDYRQAPRKLVGWVHAVPVGKLTNAGQIAVTVASDKPAQLLLQVEEVGGGKYNATFEVPGGSTAKEYVLPFADFKPAEDSDDPDGRLDLDQVHQIVILDLSGAIGQADQPNTLWFNNLRTAPAK
jgi:hypothetical protein